MKVGCLVNNFTHLDKRCANDKRFVHPTLATSSPYLNTINAGLLGGDVSMANTVFTNYYYGENKDLVTSFKLGAVFGSLGYSVGVGVVNSLSPRLINPALDRSTSVLYQSYANPRAEYIGNSIIGASISSIPSFIDLPDKKK